MIEIAALGMVECRSLSKGSLVADAMLKTSRVHLLMAYPVSTGKMLVVVDGPVADVEAAVTVGLQVAGDQLEDALFIPRLHPELAEVFMRPVDAFDVEALGMIETRSVAAGIRAADAALKAAKVQLLSIRLGRGIGGKAMVYFSGSVADCQAGVDSGKAAVQPASLLADSAVIAQPHEDFALYLSRGSGQVPPIQGVDIPAEEN